MIKVAIIDDDASVRNTIAAVLKASGINAATFESASHFLNSARIEDFKVMLVDKDMPGMSGEEFHDLVKSKNHELPKFILMSGSLSVEETTSANMPQDPILLAKPFSLSNLLKLVGDS